MAVVCPAGDVRRMLELAAIDMTLPVFEDREQAATAVLEKDP